MLKFQLNLVRPREDLTSTQEEADTRLLLHAFHAARNGSKAVVISSEDTDVFVLCLAFKDFVPATMYLKCGSQTRTRFDSKPNVFERRGSRICKCLPGLHAFTGCDSVSAFSGKGKLTALKLVKRRPAYQELFQQLGAEWELSDELFLRLQDFTCLMYSSNPGTRDVNVHVALPSLLRQERRVTVAPASAVPGHITKALRESKLSVSNMAHESSKLTLNPLAHWFWMVSK